jgi:hypothetical protein
MYQAAFIIVVTDFVSQLPIRRSTSLKRGPTMRRFSARMTFSNYRSKCAIGDLYAQSMSGLATGLLHYTGAGSLPCALRITAS